MSLIDELFDDTHRAAKAALSGMSQDQKKEILECLIQESINAGCSEAVLELWRQGLRAQFLQLQDTEKTSPEYLRAAYFERNLETLVRLAPPIRD